MKDMQRKADLSSKNMTSENRTLRSRFTHLEKEAESLRKRSHEAELQIKVRC